MRKMKGIVLSIALIAILSSLLTTAMAANLGPHLVWNDIDKDGIYDAGEPGIAGVTVKLFNYTNNALVATTTTAADGSYGFYGIPAGSYYEQVMAPSGFVFTIQNVFGPNPAWQDEYRDSDANSNGILSYIIIGQDETFCMWKAGLYTCSKAPGFTPGFWKHNIGIAIGEANGAYSAFQGGPLDGQKCSATLLNNLAAIVGVSLEEAYEVMSTGGGGAIAQARIDMANAFNAAAGYGPFQD